MGYISSVYSPQCVTYFRTSFIALYGFNQCETKVLSNSLRTLLKNSCVEDSFAFLKKDRCLPPAVKI